LWKKEKKRKNLVWRFRQKKRRRFFVSRASL
jgi:hypothetical protein